MFLNTRIHALHSLLQDQTLKRSPTKSMCLHLLLSRPLTKNIGQDNMNTRKISTRSYSAHLLFFFQLSRLAHFLMEQLRMAWGGAEPDAPASSASVWFGIVALEFEPLFYTVKCGSNTKSRPYQPAYKLLIKRLGILHLSNTILPLIRTMWLNIFPLCSSFF